MPMPPPPSSSSGTVAPLHHCSNAAAFLLFFFVFVGGHGGAGRRRWRRRRRPGIRVHDARGGAHVEGAVVHLPAPGVPVPERAQVRPGLQPLQLAGVARARARRHRGADGPHHRRRRLLAQGAPRVAAPPLGRRLQRRQRPQPPAPLLAPPPFPRRRRRRPRRRAVRRPRDARRQRRSKEQLVPDEQGAGVPGALLRDVVRDGQRVGVRRAAGVVPPRAEAVRALHRPARLERRRLLAPVPPLPAALLLRPHGRLRARLQHELRLRRPGRLRRAARRAAAVAVRQGAGCAQRQRPRRPRVLHLPGAVQGEGGGAAAAVHAHVPPEVRGQVAQDHLLLPSLQARAQVIDACLPDSHRYMYLLRSDCARRSAGLAP